MKRPHMVVLTLEQALEIHAIVLAETSGAKGLQDLGRLEAALTAQTQNVFGEELYKTACEKAAALMRGVIAGHPFVDGNKRTGMLAGLTFLRLNGEHVSAQKGDIENFAVKIATDKLDIAAIAAWLAEHCL